MTNGLYATAAQAAAPCASSGIPAPPDEAIEQRMPVARRRRELRVELAGEEPRMLLRRQLDHFDQQIVHRLAGDDEAQVLELLAIAVVEFVAVAMALADHVLAVQFTGERTWL